MAYPFSHHSFTPPSHRDPRNNRTSDESYHDRFPPTPTFSSPYNNAPGTPSPFNSSGFSSSSLYNSVPRTPGSPFDSSGSRTSFLSSNRRINNDSILNPDTFEIINFKHPDFIPNFYQSFKTFPSDLFTFEVHENVTKVLKHVIFQGQEGQKFYKTHCDRARHELVRKEQEFQARQIDEEIARDNMEKYFKNEIAVHLEKIKHLEACLSKEKETSAHLREESQRTRIAQMQMQKPHQDELKRVKDEYQKLLGKKKADDNSIKTLKEEISRLKKANDSLAKEKRHAEELVNKEKGRCNGLDEKYQQLQYETNMLKDDIEELNESNQSLQKDIEKKNEQLDRKIKPADSLAKLLKECRVMTVKSKKEKRGKLIEELKAAKSLLKEQKRINAENIALFNASNNENNVKKDQIEDYTKEIQGLREKLSGRKRAQSPTDKENVETKKSKPSSQCETPLQSDTTSLSSSEDYL